MALEQSKRNIQSDITKNRLLRLQTHTKQLSDLKSKLTAIKKEDSLRNIGEICALSIVNNHKITLTFFINPDTQQAFSYLKDNFERKCIDIYCNYIDRNNSNSSILSESIYSVFHLFDITYTLFIKPLNNRKYFIFLLKGKENINEIKSFHLLELTQTVITHICKSLQIKNGKHRNRHGTKAQKRKLDTNAAMIEIANEVFGGVWNESGNIVKLDEFTFTMAMNVRLGLDWDKSYFSQLFADIGENIFEYESVSDSDSLQRNENEWITFDAFIKYFETIFVNRTVYNQWKQIKSAIYHSPLWRRNKILRDQRNISVLKIKDKLRGMERLVNVLEEILIVSEERESSDEMFWRNKILKHREMIRLFQDSILTQILTENHKMRERYNALMTMKSVQSNSDRLLEIEMKYYELLNRKKMSDKTMKRVEILMKHKNDEIYRLKSELTRYKSTVSLMYSAVSVVRDSDGNGNENKREIVEKMKTDIVEKKLNVQKELDLLRNANMEQNSSDDELHKC